jgi:hypothetical protein
MMNISPAEKKSTAQVSDTTKADSSNAAKYIKNLSLET